MKITLNIIFFILAIVFGNIANLATIKFGNIVLPLPSGLSFDTVESVDKAIPLLPIQYFIFPLLAHAAGTFVAVLFISKTIKSAQLKRWVYGAIVLFFIAGVLNIYMIPATPLWFSVLDLTICYLPIGLLAFYISRQFKLFRM